MGQERFAADGVLSLWRVVPLLRFNRDIVAARVRRVGQCVAFVDGYLL